METPAVLGGERQKRSWGELILISDFLQGIAPPSLSFLARLPKAARRTKRRQAGTGGSLISF